MWDEDIRWHYIKKKNPTSEDYIKFMKDMKKLASKFLIGHIIDKAGETGSINIDDDALKCAEEEISKCYDKSLSKLIDEYNWLTITKKDKLNVLQKYKR